MLERDAVASTAGSWGAVSTLSTLRRSRLPQLRAAFAFGNRTAVAIRPLLQMRVIALARWTLLPDGKTPRHLLFETNWTGADQTYIPDFARIMPFQWHSIWGSTDGFPGPLPTTRLLEHIGDVDHGTDYYWSDYADEATTRTVLQSLELRRHVERFLARTAGKPAAACRREWDALLLAAQRLV